MIFKRIDEKFDFRIAFAALIFAFIASWARAISAVEVPAAFLIMLKEFSALARMAA